MVRVYHVQVITVPWEHAGCTVYGCWSLDWTERGVWLRQGTGEEVDRDDIDNQTDRTRLTVRGRMRVIRHRLGITEFRLVDSEVIRAEP
jgi:hypothetical protein